MLPSAATATRAAWWASPVVRFALISTPLWPMLPSTVTRAVWWVLPAPRFALTSTLLCAMLPLTAMRAVGLAFPPLPCGGEAQSFVEPGVEPFCEEDGLQLGEELPLQVWESESE